MDLISVSLGLTRIPFLPYLVATLVFLLPGAGVAVFPSVDALSRGMTPNWKGFHFRSGVSPTTTMQESREGAVGLKPDTELTGWPLRPYRFRVSGLLPRPGPARGLPGALISWHATRITTRVSTVETNRPKTSTGPRRRHRLSQSLPVLLPDWIASRTLSGPAASID